MGQGSSHPMPQQEPDEEKASWMCRMLARVIGVIAGLVAMITGLAAMISFSGWCIASGLIQICFGFVLLAMEAPCFCVWFDFIEKIGSFSESRPHWQKAFLYGVMGVLPLAMCFPFSASTWIGAGLIFVTGAFYGMLALGKKADRETMMARAGSGAPAPNDDWDATLVDKEKNANSIP